MSKRNYILFIDESGNAKMSETGQGNFLLSGLVVDRDLHSALSSYMAFLKEKSGIPTDENIHAFDLFEAERRKVYHPNGAPAKGPGGINLHQRIPFANVDTFFDRLINLIEGTDLAFSVYEINKQPYLDRINAVANREGVPAATVIKYIKRKGLNDFIYESLTRKLILDFGHFLEQHDAHGQIIAESRRQEDAAVLSAFVAVTSPSNFRHSTRFQSWSRSALSRIHSLTFQNKKGLGFGLEVADLFAWAHFYQTFGSPFPPNSQTHSRRVQRRAEEVCDVMATFFQRNGPENVSSYMVGNIARDKVSEFTEALMDYRA